MRNQEITNIDLNDLFIFLEIYQQLTLISSPPNSPSHTNTDVHTQFFAIEFRMSSRLGSTS